MAFDRKVLSNSPVDGDRSFRSCLSQKKTAFSILEFYSSDRIPTHLLIKLFCSFKIFNRSDNPHSSKFSYFFYFRQLPIFENWLFIKSASSKRIPRNWELSTDSSHLFEPVGNKTNFGLTARMFHYNSFLSNYRIYVSGERAIRFWSNTVSPNFIQPCK